MGLHNPFLYYLVLLTAYKLLPAQEAGTLNYIWPLVLVLLSIPLLDKNKPPEHHGNLYQFPWTLLISTHGDLLLFHLQQKGFHWLSAALFYGQSIGSST